MGYSRQGAGLLRLLRLHPSTRISAWSGSAKKRNPTGHTAWRNGCNAQCCVAEPRASASGSELIATLFHDGCFSGILKAPPSKVSEWLAYYQAHGIKKKKRIPVGKAAKSLVFIRVNRR